MAMLKLGEKIVSARVVILILSLVLLIPAAYGYIKTRVNYDILSYLPKDIETMEGQDILVDQFGTGAFSLYVVEGMEDKDVSALKSKIEKVDHVSKVIWYDSFAVKMSTLNSTFFHVFIVLPFCTIRSLFYCIFSLLGSAIVRLPLLPASHAPYFRSYASCFTSSSNSSPAE